MNRFTKELRDNAVMEIADDGSRRIWLGDYPLGRKCQAPGSRCLGDHDFYIDKYPGVRHEYVDKVCRNCTRRVPVK